MKILIWIVFLVTLATTWQAVHPCRIVRHVMLGVRLLRPCRWKWGPCSRRCGGGLQYPYKIRRQGLLRRCKMPTKPQICNRQCCPKNGYWIPSSKDWTPCSISCGGTGVQKKDKICVGPYCGGRQCYGPAYYTQKCKNGPCPITCSWSSWKSWSACSLTCGGGTHFRSRYHAVEAQHGGLKCQGYSREYQSCNTGCCPESCIWSGWGSWKNCSVSCDWGIQHRQRGETVVSSCGGDSCEGAPTETRECYAGCCPVDCIWGEWGTWSHCSSTCGTGSRRRHRPRAVLAGCGGKDCIGESYVTEACNKHCCASDCKWGEWGQWSNCSKSCDLGVFTRYRNASAEASCGGLECRGKNSDQEYCNAFCCPDHCNWEEWSEWSECTATCGVGQQAHSRSVTIDPDCQVQRCPGTHHEERNCTQACCPVDCEVSSWTQWSDCSATCGVRGQKSRFRNITTQPECGGRECEPPLLETASCNRFCFHNGTPINEICSCRDGWEGECCEDDVDECATITCMENSACFNSYGSYECVCNHKFTKENEMCVPLTKCHTGEHDCHENAQCISTDHQYKCECEPGFGGNGTFCQDVDECELEAKEMKKILDQVGSGETDPLVLAEAGGGLSPLCHVDASCKNNIGGYKCECDTGFVGNGSVCEDVDECILLETMKDFSEEDESESEFQLEFCHKNASCFNGPGSYACTCDDGYYGDGFICNELNECESIPCKNDGECEDLINSYKCSCKIGYSGSTCEEDIDECVAESHGCVPENEICVNTPGNYTCSCVEGLTRINGLCQENSPENE